MLLEQEKNGEKVGGEAAFAPPAGDHPAKELHKSDSVVHPPFFWQALQR